MAMASMARRCVADEVLRRRPHGAAWALAGRGFAASGEAIDVVVIGGRPSGYVAGIMAAQLGSEHMGRSLQPLWQRHRVDFAIYVQNYERTCPVF
jgi:hypothetical protein